MRRLQSLAKKDIPVEVKARKQNRASFHSRHPMSIRHTLELVHTDVCYMDAKSHRGAQDYTRNL